MKIQVAILLASVLAPAAAIACDCVSRQPEAAVAFERATLVVEGTVLKTAAESIEVAVKKVLKSDGRTGKTVTISTATSDCGIHFAAGTNVLLYARRHEGQYNVEQCVADVRVVSGKDVGDEVSRLESRQAKHSNTSR